MNVFFYLKPECLPGGDVWEGSNTESAMPSSQQRSMVTMGLQIYCFFRNMTMGRTTDGRRTDVGNIAYLAVKAEQQ